MKKRMLIFMAACLAVLCTMQGARATIWRVNNNSNYNGTTLWGDNYGGTSLYPVFKQLTNAASSNFVLNGDTVYLEGSAFEYSGLIVNKILVIIGPGYFLQDNPNVSDSKLEAQVDYIQFNPTSGGSQLIGVHVTGLIGINIEASNILIKRCRIDNSIQSFNNISDITIEQNFFSGLSRNSAVDVQPSGFPSNFVFNNNICQKTLLLKYNNTIYTAAECNNNVFDFTPINGGPSIVLNTSHFQNNILKTSGATVNINDNVRNENVSYNIGSSASQFDVTYNNIVVANMITLFVNPPLTTTDNSYQLLPGSPGSNNGSDGTDRGAFGGTTVTNRYTLSGLPPVPVIYYITTTGVASPAGLPVSIKARTIK